MLVDVYGTGEIISINNEVKSFIIIVTLIVFDLKFLFVRISDIGEP